MWVDWAGLDRLFGAAAAGCRSRGGSPSSSRSRLERKEPTPGSSGISIGPLWSAHSQHASKRPPVLSARDRGLCVCARLRRGRSGQAASQCMAEVGGDGPASLVRRVAWPGLEDLPPSRVDQARCYWNGYGTQGNHPAQGRTVFSSAIRLTSPLSALDSSITSSCERLSLSRVVLLLP